MKAKRLSGIFIALALLGLIGFYFLSQPASTRSSLEPKRDTATTLAAPPSTSTNNPSVAGQSGSQQARATSGPITNANPNDSRPITGLFRTGVNPASGASVFANTDQDTITLVDKNDHMVWTTNVINATQDLPINGERKIHSLQVYKGNLWVGVGKGFILVNLTNGNLIGLAAN